jgi:hypothetical protein
LVLGLCLCCAVVQMSSAFLEIGVCLFLLVGSIGSRAFHIAAVATFLLFNFAAQCPAFPSSLSSHPLLLCRFVEGRCCGVFGRIWCWSAVLHRQIQQHSQQWSSTHHPLPFICFELLSPWFVGCVQVGTTLCCRSLRSAFILGSRVCG